MNYNDMPTKQILEQAQNGDLKACKELSKRYSTGTPQLKKDKNLADYWERKSRGEEVENLMIANDSRNEKLLDVINSLINSKQNSNDMNIVSLSDKTLSPASSGNELDRIIQECVGEIEMVEKELNSQLDEIGNKIDAGFNQMANLVATITDVAVNVSQGIISDRNREKMELWGEITAKAIDVIGATYNAYQHNKTLDKLLVQKQAIASAKRASLQRILPVIDKTHDKLQKIVLAEGGKSYDFPKLENQPVRDMLFQNMDRILFAYRASEYVYLISEYLLAEYNAWLNGEQRSSIARPTYLDVNQNIIALLAPDENSNIREISKTIASNPRKISGASLYFLRDASLTSVLLLGEGMVPDENNPGEDTFVTQEVPEISSSIMEEILEDNGTFQSFKSSSIEYKTVKENDKSGMVGCILFPLSIVATWAVFHYVFSDWATWLQWVVGIIAGGILIFIVGIIVNNMSEKVKAKLEEINSYNFQDLIDRTGYVEIQEPDVEKKSVLGTAVSGLLDMVGGAEGITKGITNFLSKR